MGLASNGLCVEIVIQRFSRILARFDKYWGLGAAKSGSLELVMSREGLGSIWVDPYWCQDPTNLMISLFGPFGGQFGPISHYFSLFGGPYG